jgi:signal transduction histidine kinase
VRASRDAERITDLVETLLDVSRIATGHFELQPRSFDLAEAVNHVLDSLRETAAQARCTLVARIEAPLEGVWDRLRLEQVTMNLLSNALRYGAGAPVEVTLRGQGDDAVLEVSDHGPGVAPGDAERIFGRFERASSLRHYGGLGLGLYVAREIAAAHGGAVTVENLPAGGARFTVRVPRQPAMSASAVGQIGAG